MNVSGCGAAGSALDWGSRGRRFKSCHSDQKAVSIFCSGLLFYLNYRFNICGRLTPGGQALRTSARSARSSEFEKAQRSKVVALQAKATFGNRKRQPQVQGLGCRLGRCFCALHRGVHWTPAPCHSDQKAVSTFWLKLLFHLNYRFLNCG